MTAQQTSQTLTPSEFIGLERQAGFPKSSWALGLATAQVESGLQTNPNPGAAHQGLFQIDATYPGKVTGMSSGPLSDPLTNVKDAFVLWKNAGGTFAKDWWPFETVSYKNYLPDAQRAVNGAQYSSSNALGTNTDVPPPSAGSGISPWILVGGAVILVLLLVRK